jgi:anti-sigma factor RsiW
MNCQEVIEFMQRYMDGDLDQHETSLMMDHVGQCPDCAAMLVRLQRLSSELEQLPRVVPRFSLVDAILPELEKLQSEETADVSRSQENYIASPSSPRSNRPRRNLFRKVSGVVAAGVVAGLILFSQPSQWSFSGSSSNHDDAAAPMAQEEGAMNFSVTQKSATTDASNDSNVRSNDADTSDKSISGSLNGSGSVAGSEPAARSEASAEASAEPQQNAISPDNAGKLKKPDTSAEDRAFSISNAETPMEAPAAERSKMTAGSVPATGAVSKDGQWRAIAVEGAGTIQVFRTADETELFHSEVRDGQISLLSWNEDSTIVYYTFTDAQGIQTQWQYDVENGIESQR